MKLNLDFYDNRPEQIPDETKQIIENYINKYDDNNYEKYFNEKITDKEMYYLSRFSQNVINWYPFNKNDSVLEIGGDLGQITQVFIENCKEVVSIEPNLIKAKAIEKRYKNEENIEVIVGNIENIKLERKFKIITLIGIVSRIEEIFGKNIEIKDVIKQLEKYLDEDGIILLVVDNKFGLRFFSGNPDNILDTKYQSLIGYSNELNHIETFTKNKIENQIKELGYNTNFYYPLPDYRLPDVIFSDKQLPKYNTIDKYNVYYKEKSTILMNEIDVFREILKDNPDIFTFLANSFFVEITNKKKEIKYKYISFNNMRKEEYRLITKISNDIVEKNCIGTSSVNHYENIKNNLNILKNNNIKSLDYIEDNKINSKYINEKLMLSNLLTEALEKNEIDFVEKIMNKYIETLKIGSYKETNYDNTIFKKYNIEIENKEIINELNFQNYGLWDMTFTNCFYIDDEMYFFDQEWMEEKMPIEYILYRSIMYTISLRRFVNVNDWLKKYDLIKYTDLFKELDDKLQEKIRDTKIWSFYNQDKYVDVDATIQEVINLNIRNSAQQKAIENLNNNVEFLNKELERFKEKCNGYEEKIRQEIEGRTLVEKIIRKMRNQKD